MMERAPLPQLGPAVEFQLQQSAECGVGLRQEIDAFLDSQDSSHPFQFPSWLNLANQDESERTCFATLRDRGNLVWYSLCGLSQPFGRRVSTVRTLSLNRGPVCDDRDWTIRGLSELARTSGARSLAYVDILPEWPLERWTTLGNDLEAQGWTSRGETRSTLRLKLQKTDEDLLAGFRKATRYEIRRSEREMVEVRAASGEDELRDFQKMYAAMAAAKKFAAEDTSRLISILRWLQVEKARGTLLLALKDGVLLGGTVVVRAAKRSWYVFGATTKEDRLSAGHLLQWRAMQWAREQGCVEHDLGGYRENVNTGPALFKRGFCQEVVRFAPSCRYVNNRPLSLLAERLAKVRSAVSVARSRRAHP